MPDVVEYRLEIDGLTPDTIPMSRLLRYLHDLAQMLGNDSDIHFRRVEEGSAVPVVAVGRAAIPRVEKRLVALEGGKAAPAVQKAYCDLDAKLSEDGASARLRSPYGLLISFPGRNRMAEQAVGPVIEPAEIEGEIVEISGRDETISIWLKDGSRLHRCTATRAQGREIGAHIFTRVRVSGIAHWKRLPNEKWVLEDFVASSFRVVKIGKLSDAVRELHKLGSTRSAEVGDPVRFLQQLNQDDLEVPRA